MLRKVLIANRGEIACRIIRSCRELGIASVAVYSEPDRDLPHVALADQAVCLGGANASDSYLNISRLMAAIRETGADAVHPGYGFLSENTEFARTCEAEGTIFIGPPAEAIRVMGDKAAARQLMAEHGVPVLPGFDREGASDDELRAAADRVGFPLLIKAVAGGGGKGMRVVNQASEFDEALSAARREALGAFADDRVLLERYLPKARHVEVQVFADQHGNTVHLFERDCSVQRRHQKIIEEAPAPGLDERLRQAMGEAAVKAARAIDYRGAGTVEFLLGDQQEFFFMEMNTRLQVEHPVTELITGEDLVAWQLHVAAGAPLPRQQSQLHWQGHAMEVRIYAEDPSRQFMPSSGVLLPLQWPTQLARVDAGYQAGNRVSSHYDPMLAKIIVHGENRDQARRKLVKALLQTRLHGPRTNIAFLVRVLDSEPFVRAELDTRLLEHHPSLLDTPEAPIALQALAAALALQQPGDGADPWHSLPAWRGSGRRASSLVLGSAQGQVPVALHANGNHWQARIEGESASLSWHFHADALHLTWGAQHWQGTVSRTPDGAVLVCSEGQCQLWQVDPAPEERGADASDQAFAAPMSGRIVACHVAPGTRVEPGAAVITLEAMKMEHTLRASVAGTVAAYLVSEGDQVSEATALVSFEAAADDD